MIDSLLLRLSLLLIGVLILVAVYWTGRPRKQRPPTSEPIERQRADDPVPRLQGSLSAVEESLDGEELRDELDALSRVLVADREHAPPADGPSAGQPSAPAPAPPTGPDVVPAIEDGEPDAGPEPLHPDHQDRDEGAGHSRIILLHVAARGSRGYAGPALLAAAEEVGLTLGDMGVFHYHGDGERLYSVVNMVEPGHFETARSPGFSTPGITFILPLPGPEDPLLAFDEMIRGIDLMAARLGAEVRDEQRLPVTMQRIQELRRDVAEFAEPLQT